jgi:iron complex outermembrane receptor protein
MTGDRIVISEDGQKTQDLSATSPDHAVTVEPFTAERIEVSRGPAVLMRTSTTIGGVVNVVRAEVPETLPEQVAVGAGASGESASDGYIFSGVLTVPVSHVVGRGEYSYKRSFDLRTPAGTLPNTYGEVKNGSLGASYIDQWGYAGGAIREVDMRYGVPGGFVGAHPDGVDIELLRRTYAARTSIHVAGDVVDHLTAGGSRTYYHHTEYEKSGAIGAEFTITSYAALLEAQHTPLGAFRFGTWGVSFESRDFSVGGFVFTPPTLSRNISLYALETLTLGDLELQGGVRVGFDQLRPREEDPDASIGPIHARNFATLSYSALAQFSFSPRWQAGLTFSRTSRVPTIEELYSEGPHLAAYSYEIGNPLLSEEYGYGGEMFVRNTAEGFEGFLAGFYFVLPSYIIAQNTGEINYATLLPVYATTGVSARLTGVEGEATLTALEPLAVSASISYTWGDNRSSGYPLPAIPPLRGLIDVKYRFSTWTIGVSSELASAQDRIDEFETPTAGYAVVNAYVQTSIFTGPIVHNISVMLDNVADTEYRNHLSRVKSIAPEPGRNLRLVYRLTY